MFILKRNLTGYSFPARDYEKRGKVTTFLTHTQILSLFFAKNLDCLTDCFDCYSLMVNTRLNNLKKNITLFV